MKIKPVIVFTSIWAIAISEVLEVKPELSGLLRHRLSALNPSTKSHVNKYDPGFIVVKQVREPRRTTHVCYALFG
jgi:hypothetical protein